LSVLVALTVGITANAPAQNTSRPGPHRKATRSKRPPRNKAKHNRRNGRPPATSRHGRQGRDRFGRDRSRSTRGNNEIAFAPYIDPRFGYIPTYDDFGYLNSADYLYLQSGQQYYNDGPNGPGYYDQSRWYTWYVASHRSDQLLGASRARLDQGMEAFRAGRYDRAAIAWLGASRMNEEDAASRVHAGHALFAVGRYDSAVKLLARAFELTPQLATSSYDIRGDYANPADFYDQLDTLKRFVVAHPNNADGVTLLGYVKFYTTGPASAYRLLKEAARMRPADTFIPKLLEVARMVSPQDGVKPNPHEKPTGAKSRTGKESSALRQSPRIKKIRTEQPG